MAQRHLFAALACIVSGTASAQSTPSIAFEVASVKENTAPAGAARAMTIENGTGVTYIRTTLLRLVMRAYNVRYFQVIAPPWFSALYYDVSARMPEGVAKEQVPQMLQELLQARFGLRLHKKSRDTPIYALTAPSGTAKLKTCEAQECPHEFLAHAMNGSTYLHANTLERLAADLSAVTDRPVQDFTGLRGTFDITLPEFMAAGAASGDDANAQIALPSVFTVVRSFGLNLEARRAQLEYLVVDSADRVPAPN